MFISATVSAPFILPDRKKPATVGWHCQRWLRRATLGGDLKPDLSTSTLHGAVPWSMNPTATALQISSPGLLVHRNWAARCASHNT